MGKVKYIKHIREFFKETPIVTIDSLKKFIPKNNKDYIYLVINKLLNKGEIKKITKGFYTIHQDPSLIVFCFKPSYLGLQDALSIHNLWEQETNPIVITSKKVRQGLRKVFENNVVVKRIKGKYLFGFEYIKQGDFYYPYSDIEKTFIDMVYFKQKLTEDTIKNILKKINKKKLSSYIRMYPKKTRERITMLVANR